MCVCVSLSWGLCNKHWGAQTRPRRPTSGTAGRQQQGEPLSLVAASLHRKDMPRGFEYCFSHFLSLYSISSGATLSLLQPPSTSSLDVLLLQSVCLCESPARTTTRPTDTDPQLTKAHSSIRSSTALCIISRPCFLDIRQGFLPRSPRHVGTVSLSEFRESGAVYSGIFGVSVPVVVASVRLLTTISSHPHTHCRCTRRFRSSLEQKKG